MLLDLILEALGDTLDLILEAVGDMQDTWGSTLRFLTIFDGFGVPFGVQFEVNLMPGLPLPSQQGSKGNQTTPHQLNHTTPTKPQQTTRYHNTPLYNTIYIYLKGFAPAAGPLKSMIP